MESLQILDSALPYERHLYTSAMINEEDSEMMLWPGPSDLSPLRFQPLLCHGPVKSVTYNESDVFPWPIARGKSFSDVKGPLQRGCKQFVVCPGLSARK
jgi:hypothetical protein